MHDEDLQFIPIEEGAAGMSRLRLRVLAVLGTFSSIALSVAPESFKNEFHMRGKLHTPGHLLLFSVISFAALRSASSKMQRLLIIMSLSALCLALEVVEQRLFHGPMEWQDVWVDTLAVAVGALVAAFFSHPRISGGRQPL